MGIDREWVVCPVCHGTGSSDEVRGRSGQGGQCPGNREGVHTMIREDGPVGAKWKCKLCYVRW
ncbi:MAG: hypothetical protein HOV68_07025 [Streptomycetaceae bacterium]|nr:hypothetical protein [Streptomycetaceae bacterium]